MGDISYDIHRAISTLENPARVYMQRAKIDRVGDDYVLEFTDKRLYDLYSEPNSERAKEVINHIYNVAGVIVGFRYKDLSENVKLLSGVSPSLTEDDIKDITQEDIEYIKKLGKLSIPIRNFIKAGIDHAYNEQFGHQSN